MYDNEFYNRFWDNLGLMIIFRLWSSIEIIIKLSSRPAVSSLQSVWPFDKLHLLETSMDIDSTEFSGLQLIFTQWKFQTTWFVQEFVFVANNFIFDNNDSESGLYRYIDWLHLLCFLSLGNVIAISVTANMRSDVVKVYLLVSVN